MKPHRPSAFADAAPVDGRSHGRTPAVQLLIDERNDLIRTAAKFYPGCSDREIARRLRTALSIYRDGRRAHLLHRIPLRKEDAAVVVIEADEVVTFKGHVQLARAHRQGLPCGRAARLDEGWDELPAQFDVPVLVAAPAHCAALWLLFAHAMSRERTQERTSGVGLMGMT
jgi:hypothetical protein